MLGVDEYAPRLDAEEETQKLRHAPVCLVWDDMIYRLDTGPQSARGRDVCRDFEARHEVPRRGHSNPDLGAAALRAALDEARLEVGVAWRS
jgi:hypothetical protein